MAIQEILLLGQRSPRCLPVTNRNYKEYYGNEQSLRLVIKMENATEKANRRKSLLPQRRSARPSSPYLNDNGQQTTEVVIGATPKYVEIAGSKPVNSTLRRQSSMLPGKTSRLIYASQARKLSTTNQQSHGDLRDVIEECPKEGQVSFNRRASRIAAVQHARHSSLPTILFKHQASASSSRTVSTTHSALQQPKSRMGRASTSSISPPSHLDQSNLRIDDIYGSQLELGQLHLLHRSASTTQVQWQESAKAYFQNRFEALQGQHDELQEIAHQQQVLINQLALLEWSEGKSGTQNAEDVQSFSKAIAEIASLLATNGKYTLLVADFESWFTQSQHVLNQEEPDWSEPNLPNAIMAGIGDEWKTDAILLERELAYFLRDMKSFRVVRSSSTLGRLQALYSKLIASLIEELDMIQWLEDEIAVGSSVRVE